MNHAREVDLDTCTRCGVCVRICPSSAIEMDEAGPVFIEPDHLPCLGCGHCVAYCPKAAVSMPAVATRDLPEAPSDDLGLAALLGGRRSCRGFRDRPVERAQIERILELTALAPMGIPPHDTEVLVLDRREDIEQLLVMARKLYGKLLKALDHPVARHMVRLKAGAEVYHAVASHASHVVRLANQWEAEGRDRYTYEAPALLIFHARKGGIGPRDDAFITATYAMLAAHAQGLGTIMLSIVPPAVERSKELRAWLGIPDDHEVMMSVALGHPKHRPKRSIERELAAVRFFGDDASTQTAQA